MQQGMFLFSVILCAQTVLAQTVAVKFASDAGVFVGAATACGMMNLVARYTLRVDMVLTDIASTTWLIPTAISPQPPSTP